MKILLYILAIFLSVSVQAQSIFIIASDTTICPGTSVTFTATAGGSTTPHYQWKINGSNAGTDSAKFTTSLLTDADTITCLLTDSIGTLLVTSGSIVMHVIPLPYAGVITGLDTVCLGASITLSSTAPGGIWVAQGFNIEVDTGIVKGIHAGFSFECSSDPGYDTVRYIVANSCGSDTAYKPILIHPLANPFFFFGNGYDNSVCVGGAVYISGGIGACAPIYSKYGYAWASWDHISGVSPGLDSLYSIATNYCGTQTYAARFLVIGKPAVSEIISSSTKMCIGDSIKLAVSNTSYETIWYSSNSNGMLSNGYANTVSLSGIKAGLDTVTLRKANGCGYTENLIAITIDSLPQSIFIPNNACKGHSLQLKINSSGGQWSSSNAEIATINTEGIVSAIKQGDISISYTLPTGCYTTQQLNIANCPEVVKVFPNPANEEITILTLTANNYYECIVTNSIGQVVIRQKIIREYTTISTSELSPGIYLITLAGDTERYTRKFVKE